MDNNAYLLEDAQTGELVLIDAANEAPRLLELLGGRPLRHDRHHPPALGPLAGARRGAGRDGRRRSSPTPTTRPGLPVPVTTLVQNGDSVPVGSAAISVIHLRGHTPGSIALCYDAGGALSATPHLFTGDSLFPGGPGNTEQDPKRFGQLMDDLEERVFAVLPDGTWVYPGHGKRHHTRLQRPHVQEWRARGW